MLPYSFSHDGRNAYERALRRVRRRCSHRVDVTSTSDQYFQIVRELKPLIKVCEKEFGAPIYTQEGMYNDEAVWDWIETTIPTFRFYFKHQRDAMKFKLKWG